MPECNPNINDEITRIPKGIPEMMRMRMMMRVSMKMTMRMKMRMRMKMAMVMFVFWRQVRDCCCCCSSSIAFVFAGRAALQRQRLRWPRLPAVRGHAQIQRLLEQPNSFWAAGRPTTACALHGIPCYYGGASFYSVYTIYVPSPASRPQSMLSNALSLIHI